MEDFKKFSNSNLARMFNEIAAVYEVTGQSFFRTRAYQNAAIAINSSSSQIRDLWDEEKLDTVAGLGTAIISYLDEYFKTGKVSHFDFVRKNVPAGMFNLLDIPGIGPKTAFRLAGELEISSREDLISACKLGKIASLKGFGEKSQSDLLNSALTPRIKKDRVLLFTALTIADDFKKYMQKCSSVIACDFLGSLRRRVATVGDIDLSVATGSPEVVIDHFCKYKEVAKVENGGNKKASVILKNDQRVDLMTGDQASYGTLLAHLTGSKLHNIALRTYALERGFSISEYGIKKPSGEQEKFKTEKEMYEFLGLEYIPPELREGGEEISVALNHKLPDLVDSLDIKGDLQMHTIYSDGVNTIKEMADKAINLGYEYIGITDHSLSPNTHTEKEIVGAVNRYYQEIAQFNYPKSNIRVLLGTECNILSDGRLSLSDNILSIFDFAIASIHTAFNQPKDQITERLLNAVSNPYINFIGHPSGRVLLERLAYDVDWGQFFSYCIKYKKPIEINAFPTRLDLADDLVKKAKDLGIKFIINTDSHSTAHMDYMKYGVFTARRGWCSKEDILNAQSFSVIAKALSLRNL